jgi:hypothetical protein
MLICNVVQERCKGAAVARLLAAAPQSREDDEWKAPRCGKSEDKATEPPRLRRSTCLCTKALVDGIILKVRGKDSNVAVLC